MGRFLESLPPPKLFLRTLSYTLNSGWGSSIGSVGVCNREEFITALILSSSARKLTFSAPTASAVHFAFSRPEPDPRNSFTQSISDLIVTEYQLRSHFWSLCGHLISCCRSADTEFRSVTRSADSLHTWTNVRDYRQDHSWDLWEWCGYTGRSVFDD